MTFFGFLKVKSQEWTFYDPFKFKSDFKSDDESL